MRKLYAGLAAAALVGLVAGPLVYTSFQGDADIFAQCRQGQIGGGAIGGPFTLVNGDGQTVTEKDVITKPSLVYFGYTFCPDVCPMDNARNAEAIDLLDAAGVDVQPVFISIDPKRDTPEVVKDFAANLHIAELLTDKLEAQCEWLSRDVKVRTGRFNQHIAPRCILIECGTNENTLEEVLCGIPYLAQAIAETLDALEAETMSNEE